MVREAGIGWQLARLWPGSRARERQIKRQGGHARKCPLCGVHPRVLPRNRDGSLSRSRTTDAQKHAAGVMTAAQLAEHTALRRGAVTGKPDRPAERGRWPMTRGPSIPPHRPCRAAAAPGPRPCPRRGSDLLMSLSAEFDSRADRRAYARWRPWPPRCRTTMPARSSCPSWAPPGPAVTPLMMDAVVYWLAAANVRQARVGRPLPMLRFGAYGLLALTITANALGGASLAERVFLALPAALFGFLVEARTRLALYHHRAAHGDDRLRMRLWLRHPARAFAAWLWLARRSAPAFDRATAERDQLRAARDAVRLALPGRSRAIRRARAGVLRELNAGRLPAVTAVAASGLLTRPGLPELHRAALAASLGADLATLPPLDKDTDTGPDTGRPRSRTPRRTGTAAAVARLRARHPDMPTADIARRLGVSDRTVRRHLAAPPAPAPAAAA